MPNPATTVTQRYIQSNSMMKNNGRFQSGYVALLGKPNVGKSTILNVLLQEKLSIISPRPQTTRDTILGIFSGRNHQIIFIDTPGAHRPRTELGKYMTACIHDACADADEVIVIIDALTGITAADRYVFDMLREKHAAGKRKWSAVVVNKIDRVSRQKLLSLLDACRREVAVDEYIPVSGLTGENCGLLMNKIKQVLPKGPPYYPQSQLTDKNERYIVAELVREQVLKLCRQEVPHAVAVEVDTFKQNPGRKVLIQATIFLEKETQKRIIIGKKAAMLKKIGIEARREIERFLGKKVYVELWVKVHAHWRKDRAFLRRLGYKKAG